MVRSLLVFGAPAAPSLAALQEAASGAHLALHVEQRGADAERWIDEHRPAAIVVEGSGRALEQASLRFRDNPHLAGVPIVALADAPTALDFEEAFGWGVDDIVPRRADPLVRRLRQLAKAQSAPAPHKERGSVVVADPDRRRRILVARVLRNAGFDVRFAVDAGEALVEAARPGVKFVVSSSELEPDAGATVVARARAAGADVPWVVAAPPRDASRLRQRTASVAGVAIHDVFGPPENVLFVANDLRRRTGPDARASVRLLYGTTVSFRAAGADADEVGCTYNVSGGGLYVRTLAPLERGADAWLELCPPRADRRVRLEGRVVWARGFGPNDAATVPPGFGVQITGGSVGDLERFMRGYRAFSAEVHEG